MAKIMKRMPVQIFDHQQQKMTTEHRHQLVDATAMEDLSLEVQQAIAQGLDPAELGLDASQLGDMDALTIQQGANQSIEAQAGTSEVFENYMKDQFEVQEGVVQTALPSSQAVQATGSLESTSQSKVVDVLYGRKLDD